VPLIALTAAEQPGLNFFLHLCGPPAAQGRTAPGKTLLTPSVQTMIWKSRLKKLFLSGILKQTNKKKKKAKQKFLVRKKIRSVY